MSAKEQIKAYKEDRIQRIIIDIYNNRRIRDRKILAVWAKQLIQLLK